ncbi:UNKNOWN [Stylonychia lemnae]|uniref:Uncharacterized protein n=1 Tax=Stylonychia lemnae TaxID=5949 RepID=A0A078A447_STYLE|nr:UNKNOWN [Stylonychia lemnae]|eukprot:CDW76654.1 UNKNOWN [Stylonychia lemnae]
MNEKVDINNIIEVSNTKHTKKREDGHESDEDEDETHHVKPINEEEKKYRDNVIDDLYGSISSEDEDDEEAQNDLDQQIEEEAKQKEQQLKQEQESKQGLKINPQVVMEKVNQVFEIAKNKYQQDVNTDKVKVMFNTAYSKFNTIVEKNKVNLPQFDQLLKEQPIQRSTLDNYLKKQQDKSTANTSINSQGSSSTIQKQKSLHFKIGEESIPTCSQNEHDTVEGEEFSDSEEQQQQQQTQEQIPIENKEIQKQEIQENQEEEQKESVVTNANLDGQDLSKGKQFDVTRMRLFQARKEPKRGNILKSMVVSHETRHLSLVNGHLYVFQLIPQNTAAQQIKDQIKDINTQQIKKMATSWFQKSKEKLINLKNNGLQGLQQTNQTIETSNQTIQSEGQQQPQNKLALLKSETNLERLYMIDVLERGKKEIEIIMHFVNKQYNPMMSPDIKRYRMNIDADTQQFLVSFQREVEKNSKFYLKVAQDMHNFKNQ